MDKLKVFVLGPARSGTSITYTCMRRVFRLPGRGESHVMPAFQDMIDAFHRYKAKKRPKGNIAFLSLDPARVEAHVHAFVREFYAGLYPGGAFIDKTPGPRAIHGIPVIRAIFPDARVVITKRGGIETVDSFRRKFNMPVGAASKTWTACMRAILWAQENCEDVHVVEQFDMANRTDEVAAALCAYLGQPEKTPQVARFLRENEKQASSSHDRSRPLTLGDGAWSAEEKDVFLRVSGDMMQRLSYPI
ncbi:MAG: sulfotransferase [Acetobacteraceae bacterium]|nr:sulfotransferase [Acetobacteraceae bacterium]